MTNYTVEIISTIQGDRKSDLCRMTVNLEAGRRLRRWLSPRPSLAKESKKQGPRPPKLTLTKVYIQEMLKTAYLGCLGGKYGVNIKQSVIYLKCIKRRIFFDLMEILEAHTYNIVGEKGL